MPAPEAVIIHQSHEAPLYEGTTFHLSCIITPNRTGVDTDFDFHQQLFWPREVMRRITQTEVMTFGNTFQVNLTFNPLSLSDNGFHVCSATMISMLQYVTNSDATVNNIAILISCELTLHHVNYASHASIHQLPFLYYSSAFPYCDHHSNLFTYSWSETQPHVHCYN